MTSSIIALLLIAPAKVDLNVNVKNGEILSGTRSFRVMIQADDPINQVEFYVGDELRDTDSSTPYEFLLDTIEEAEGNSKFTFAVYTNKGDSAKKTYTVKIDNAVDKGADFHANNALNLIIDQKWDEAIVAGRIAMKADPNSQLARMAMARAYMGKGVLDRAQKYAEDYAAQEPESLEGKELMIGVNMKLALRTVDREGNKAETQARIAEAFKSAIATRRAILEARLDAIGEPNEANLLKYTDAAVAAGRYTLAINALTPVVRNSEPKAPINNRYAYALIKAGRYDEALNALNRIEKFSKLDAWGLAAKAALLAVYNDRDNTTEYLKQALLMDPNDLSVRTAQAFVALRDFNVPVLRQLAGRMDSDAGQKPEVAYYSFALANALQDYAKSRAFFERAVLAEPLTEEVYIERGNVALAALSRPGISLQERQFQANSAKVMYEAALEVRPEAYRALIGLAMCYINLNDKEQALKFAEAAVRAAPTRASTALFYASLLNSDTQAKAADEWMSKAKELDPIRLEGRGLPSRDTAWSYLVTFDRSLVLTGPK